MQCLVLIMQVLKCIAFWKKIDVWHLLATDLSWIICSSSHEMLRLSIISFCSSSHGFSSDKLFCCSSHSVLCFPSGTFSSSFTMGHSSDSSSEGVATSLESEKTRLTFLLMVTGVVACAPCPSSIKRSLTDRPMWRSCTIQLLSSPRLMMSANNVLKMRGRHASVGNYISPRMSKSLTQNVMWVNQLKRWQYKHHLLNFLLKLTISIEWNDAIDRWSFTYIFNLFIIETWCAIM